MNLWSRFLVLIGAKASRALDAAENPDETLDYAYEQQRGLLVNVRRGVADVVSAKKRLEIQMQTFAAQIQKLDGQAREAVLQGRDDLARGALERKAFAQVQYDGLHEQVERLEAQQEQLVENERRLSAKIEGFRTQKEVIKAQYSAAEAQVKIGESITGISESAVDAGAAIGRIQDRTEGMVARAAAIGELIDSDTLTDFTGESSLDRELALVSQSGQVDRELEALKGELGSGVAQAEITEEAKA